MDLFPAPDPNQSEKWYPDPDQNILDPPHCHTAHLQGRLKKLESGTNIDWGTAEALGKV